MYEILKKSWDKSKQPVLFGLVFTILLLLTVVYKNDKTISKRSEILVDIAQSTDLKTFKEFLLNQINSPFNNFNYEIKKGDTIQNVLKKLKVKDSEINTIIKQYKKYGNPNTLLVGNKIDISTKEDSPSINSIVKFSVPITKSTTIEITKNEENKIVSKKIITKL